MSAYDEHEPNQNRLIDRYGGEIVWQAKQFNMFLRESKPISVLNDALRLLIKNRCC